MKFKLLIILGIISLCFFTLGITYSAFNSDLTSYADQDLAKFVFETESLDALNLTLTDIVPGTTKDYNFSITNNSNSIKSDVTINYQLTIKTYHLIPLTIELYDSTNTLLLTCDETYSRNENNELVCNSDIFEMSYDTNKTDDYTIRLSFPSDYNSESYSSLVDFIDVEIKSWQK